jgi:hypothetical protein
MERLLRNLVPPNARLWPALFGALFLTLSCQGGSPTSSGRTVPLGTWGGVDVVLTVTATGGTLQRVCASGAIPQPMTLDMSGHFDSPGTYVVSGPGPGPSVNHPARYTGTTDGNTMTLTILQTDDNQTVGPFTLTLGQITNIGPCPIL